MTKREATNYYKRLCRCVKHRRFCVKLKDRVGEFGGVDWGEPDTIVLNPRRRSPLVRTLIHELLHILCDDFSESQVSKLEKELFEAMSDAQLNGLFKRVMAHDLDMAS